jgi:hypothetical protein
MVEVEKTETDKIVAIIKKKQDILNQEIKIEDFIKSFTREYTRQPTVVAKSSWLNRNKSKI